MIKQVTFVNGSMELNGITVFGQSILVRGDRWLVNGWQPVWPKTEHQEVENFLWSVIEKLNLVAEIVVSPYIFNALYIQGIITYHHIKQAKEESETYTKVYGVNFLGNPYTVVTKPYDQLVEEYGEDFKIVFIDINGNPI